MPLNNASRFVVYSICGLALCFFVILASRGKLLDDLWIYTLSPIMGLLGVLCPHQTDRIMQQIGNLLVRIIGRK